MILRPYQEKIIADVRAAIRDGHKRILIQSPTGSGKTVMFSNMLVNSVAKGYRPMFTVPSREVLKASSRALSEHGLEHGFIADGFLSNPHTPAQLAMIPTLANRIDRIQSPSFIVIDEAHHSPAARYRKLWDKWPDVLKIGLTATPWRLDGKGLGDLYDIMIHGPTVSELILAGHLAPFQAFSPPQVIDLSGVKTTMGDYNSNQLAIAADKPTITGDAIAHYKTLAYGKRAVVGAVNIQHSQHISRDFLSAGIPSAHVDGKMSVADRDRIIADFVAGRVLVLCQVGILTEGVDIPGIECAISLRPTQSLSLWLQFIGRALRFIPGKTAIILDHVGNGLRHGWPSTPREWTLDGEVKKSKRGPVERVDTGLKLCEKCFAQVDKILLACPRCGEVFPLSKTGIKTVDGTLVKVDLDAAIKLKETRKELKKSIGTARTEQELEILRKRLGYKYGWSQHILKAREKNASQGFEPEYRYV